MFRSRPSASAALFRKLTLSLAIASVGAYIGFKLAIYFLPPELHKSSLTAFYAVLGSVSALLFVRLTVLVALIVRDFLHTRS